MRSKWRILFLVLTILLSAVLLFGCAQKKYPSKSIDVVCPGSAGSGGDVLLRVICKYLSEELGVPVNVINTPGGGGIPAVSSVLTAQPDGYTLMGDQGLSSTFQVLLDELPYDLYKDRTYICKVASGPQVLCGRSDMGWNNVLDVSKWIKENPDEEFLWGGIGKNSAANFAALQFMLETGIDPSKTKELRYSGGGDILAAIAGKHIMFGSSASSGVPSFAQDGLVKPLVVCGKNKLDILPDTPSAAELGLETLNADFWIGFSGTSKLPTEVTERIESACKKIITNKAFLEDIAKIGAVVNFKSGEELIKEMQAESVMVTELSKLGSN